MLTLGRIKWGVQYNSINPGDSSSSTKTINGLNFDETATQEAESINAALAAAFVNHLVGLSNNTLNTVSLIKTQGVEDDA